LPSRYLALFSYVTHTGCRPRHSQAPRQGSTCDRRVARASRTLRLRLLEEPGSVWIPTPHCSRHSHRFGDCARCGCRRGLPGALSRTTATSMTTPTVSGLESIVSDDGERARATKINFLMVL
jgi:hypothetical protein